jgi:hypothetical protein
MENDAPVIPVSWGELIDKITILEIKSRKLKAEAALANVRKELASLTEIVARDVLRRGELVDLKDRLTKVNEELWTIEDRIREKEAAKAFDAEFIALARSVYLRNDERSRIKREINVRLSSNLVEEKSYSPY